MRYLVHPSCRLNGADDYGLDEAMDDEFLVTCPYCGEIAEIYVEPDVTGSFVQTARSAAIPGGGEAWAEGDSQVEVTRDDGSG